MSILNPPSHTDFDVEVTQSGSFTPRVYGVAAGSLAANQSYGAGAAMVNSDDYSLALQINGPTTTGTTTSQAITRCDWRKQGNLVNFNLAVTIRGGGASGFTGGDELRVGAKAAASGSPPSWNVALPPASGLNQNPYFDATLTECPKASGAALTQYYPTGTTCFFRARLLADGTLALYTVTNATVLAPLTVTLLDAARNTSTTNGSVMLRIWGSYICA